MTMALEERGRQTARQRSGGGREQRQRREEAESKTGAKVGVCA